LNVRLDKAAIIHNEITASNVTTLVYFIVYCRSHCTEISQWYCYNYCSDRFSCSDAM